MSTERKQAVPTFIDLAAQREKLGDSVERAISKVLNHGQFVLGPEVTELEGRLASFCAFSLGSPPPPPSPVAA